MMIDPVLDLDRVLLDLSRDHIQIVVAQDGIKRLHVGDLRHPEIQGTGRFAPTRNATIVAKLATL